MFFEASDHSRHTDQTNLYVTAVTNIGVVNSTVNSESRV